MTRRSFITALLACASLAPLYGVSSTKAPTLAKQLSQVLTRRYTNIEWHLKGMYRSITFDTGVYYPSGDTYTHGPIDTFYPFVDDAGEMVKAVGGLKGHLQFAGKADLYAVEQVEIDLGASPDLLAGAQETDDGGLVPVSNVVLRYRLVTWV